MSHERELKKSGIFFFFPGDQTRRKNHYLKISSHGRGKLEINLLREQNLNHLVIRKANFVST